MFLMNSLSIYQPELEIIKANLQLKNRVIVRNEFASVVATE
jgi:hypothetical protein